MDAPSFVFKSCAFTIYLNSHLTWYYLLRSYLYRFYRYRNVSVMTAIEDSIRGVAVHIIVHESPANYLALISQRIIVGMIQLVYCWLARPNRGVRFGYIQSYRTMKWLPPPYYRLTILLIRIMFYNDEAVL